MKADLEFDFGDFKIVPYECGWKLLIKFLKQPTDPKTRKPTGDPVEDWKAPKYFAKFRQALLAAMDHGLTYQEDVFAALKSFEDKVDDYVPAGIDAMSKEIESLEDQVKALKTKVKTLEGE